MRFIRWTTYGCVAATLLSGFAPGLGASLAWFGIANALYQLGTVFYDALLWKITAPGRLGQISGVGASFGYLGSALGLLLLSPFVQAGGYPAAVKASAVFFLIFALPSFLLIEEDRAPGRGPAWGEVVRTAHRQLWTTLRNAHRLRGLWRYFWAAFFSLNAINTILVFMGIYTKKVLNFSHAEIVRFFVFSQLFAVAGSLILGRLVPRWGAKRTLAWIWGGWMAALGLVALVPSARAIWIAGPVIGFCLGSTWATSRVLVIELSPKGQLAEMFGLAGLFGRASSILGPLLWGALVWDPSGYRPALLVLMGLLAIGIWLLRRVPEPSGQRA
jgi:UMF1 family MFS transporter